MAMDVDQWQSTYFPGMRFWVQYLVPYENYAFASLPDALFLFIVRKMDSLHSEFKAD